MRFDSNDGNREATVTPNNAIQKHFGNALISLTKSASDRINDSTDD
jgi:hypothetical protein